MTFLSHRKVLCDKKALRAGSRCGGEENVDKSTRRRRRISQSEILSCDEDGSILGFKYNGSIYFYRKNLQGDITGIRNSAGTLITEYRYDAWGDIISVTGTQGNTIGAINPFRYRGYYWDEESWLYYLNSRYYDAVTGRFLNADSIIDGNSGIIGCNLLYMQVIPQ